MGGFYFISKDTGSDTEGLLKGGRRQFEQSGFSPPVTIQTENYVVDYYSKIGFKSKDHIEFDDRNFIFSVGTFIYKGRIGEEALRLFFDEKNHSAELQHAHGHFVLVLRKDGRTQLLKDPLGSYEVFHTPGLRCVTSSFLAAARAVPKLTISDQETYEYVFNGVSLGSSTPFAEIRRLDLSECLALEPIPEFVHQKISLIPEESHESFSTLVRHNLDGLLSYASELEKLFGSNIRLALSGGYDSRLLLALFRRVGITPQLFVYGSESSEDVRTARQIALAEGIAIHHVDKTLLRKVTPDQYLEIVEENFLREDALSWGGIFVSGAELIARKQRSDNGALHVNGGGGEVFRNFFNLLDHPITVRELVWSFYSQFDPAQCSSRFDPTGYVDKLSAKIASLLELDGTTLSRRQVEALYPYFRCRSWFGRENSINSRWGYSVLPYIDHQVVREALKVPIRYKHFGNFESAMIRSADPRLASYLSNYGHNFSKKAPLRFASQSLLTYMRPPWTRRFNFAIKARLGRPDIRLDLLSPQFLTRVINPNFPFMSKYFQVDKISSSEQFGRICTLEYVFSRLTSQ